MVDQVREIRPDPRTNVSAALEEAWKQTGKGPVRFILGGVDIVIYPKDELIQALVRYRIRRLLHFINLPAAIATILGLAVGFVVGWLAGVALVLIVLLSATVFGIATIDGPPANP